MGWEGERRALARTGPPPAATAERRRTPYGARRGDDSPWSPGRATTGRPWPRSPARPACRRASSGTTTPTATPFWPTRRGPRSRRWRDAVAADLDLDAPVPTVLRTAIARAAGAAAHPSRRAGGDHLDRRQPAGSGRSARGERGRVRGDVRPAGGAVPPGVREGTLRPLDPRLTAVTYQGARSTRCWATCAPTPTWTPDLCHRARRPAPRGHRRSDTLTAHVSTGRRTEA